jgi:hypothetical protein
MPLKLQEKIIFIRKYLSVRYRKNVSVRKTEA